MVLNELMATAPPRKKFNLELPRELKEAADEIAKRWGAKKKWLVLSAAIVAFLEADEAEQTALVKRVNEAEMGFSTYDALMAEVSKGRVPHAYTDQTGVNPRPGQKAGSPAKPKGKQAKSSTPS
jgi:predicted transcriptional regulator